MRIVQARRWSRAHSGVRKARPCSSEGATSAFHRAEGANAPMGSSAKVLPFMGDAACDFSRDYGSGSTHAGAVLAEERKSSRGAQPAAVLVDVLENLARMAGELDVNVSLCGRIKAPNSIREKLISSGEVLDVIGVRAITDDVAECYRLMKLINRRYRTVEGSFDDYIASPKDNGYQSIHTTVLVRHETPVEIQARTWWMHEVSERGSASHSRYKRDRWCRPVSHRFAKREGMTS